MKDLLDYRTEFESLENCHHLIANSLGAMPNKARECSDRYLKLWSTRGVRAWEEEWWMIARTVGDKIGSLMNAASDTVSIHANVTSAQATVLSCFDFDKPRDKVVMVQQEFPSLLYLYRQTLRDRGRLEIVPCPDGMTVPTQAVLDAIDETTALVSISQVLFKSAYIVDVAAVIEKAHRVGALVLVDIFQGLGAVPVDIQTLGADFAAGGCLKWLCGGPGVGYLYVKPEVALELTPRFTGWLAHENPFAFDPSPIRFAEGSYKWMNGTPAVPALYTCQPGLDIITEIGVPRIRKRSLEMTSRLAQLAREREWSVFTPEDPKHRGGTITLNVAKAETVTRELLARSFLVDYRPGAGIRVSPHFYNSDQEIDDLVVEIEKILTELSVKQKT
ncbi:MAG: aminotransferase class V-fold PLP-dependent enzyme [candidate division Zixibacteria bacterium]|nr:aminotransferase class V-fold PLP-dependent enzyme [candidate division Zixibacteria bacterium]MDH3936178.1 aminotransferase class V-fold PLP-dependent enzyme [candidate division Zixibacteria bacterium]MDH4032978.1 aminotransferase class V-fold PLP-dependent enzyme [candidate division Zixibacteria bacterium]